MYMPPLPTIGEVNPYTKSLQIDSQELTDRLPMLATIQSNCIAEEPFRESSIT